MAASIRNVGPLPLPWFFGSSLARPFFFLNFNAPTALALVSSAPTTRHLANTTEDIAGNPCPLQTAISQAKKCPAPFPESHEAPPTEKGQLSETTSRPALQSR